MPQVLHLKTEENNLTGGLRIKSDVCKALISVTGNIVSVQGMSAISAP